MYTIKPGSWIAVGLLGFVTFAFWGIKAAALATAIAACGLFLLLIWMNTNE